MKDLSILDSVLYSRKERAINLLKKFDYDSWLVISAGNDVNLEYLLGTKPHGTTVAVISRDGLFVLASRLEESMVKKNHVDSVETYYGSKELIAGIMDILSRFKDGKILLNISPPLVSFHASRILYGHADLIQKLGALYGAFFHVSHKFVWELRSIKTEAELNALKEAVRETVNVIDNIINKIRIGMTEKEVAAEIYKEIYMKGAPSFETIVAFGKNSANPHHETSNKKLRTGEIGYIDMGIKLYSMCADITRAFFTDNVDNKFYDIYSIIREAQDSSIEVIKDGVSANIPDKVARETIQKHGYDPEKVFTHGLGHPIGAEVHDVGPALTFLASSENILKKNMTETIEPAIYISEAGGIRLEDDIIIRKNDAFRLSRAPDEPPKVG